MKHILLTTLTPLSAVLLLAWTPASAFAQNGKTFKARLSPVPIDVSMQATIAGSGTVSAVLTGTKLAITGTPMENNLMELWSLLSITSPGLFPTPLADACLLQLGGSDGSAPRLLVRDSAPSREERSNNGSPISSSSLRTV